MVDAAGNGHGGGFIVTPIVNDQPFNMVKTTHVAG
jgi:hypothetical protein